MIGIITLNKDTFTNPTLTGLNYALNKKNIPVTIYCAFQERPIPKGLKLTKYVNAPGAIYIPRRPIPFFRYLITFFKMISSLKKNKINHVIAVDPYGMIMAGWAKRFIPKLHIHYFSFEIFFRDEVKVYPIIEKFKNLEIKYSRQADSILIQDQERQKLLMNENGLSTSQIKWHFIPVSISANIQKEKKYKKTDFGLKSTDIVYIHSGSIASWSGIDLIITAIKKGLPENCYIFIHSRDKFDTNDRFYQELMELKIAGHRVIIHDLFFNEYNDYNDFLSCFDFGIVLYQPDGGIYTGKNIQEIGLASGKFSAFMLANLPCLLTNCRAYQQTLNEYQIGKLVTTNEDLNYHISNFTLTTISKAECDRFYKEVLDPTKKIDEFIEYIN